MAKLLPCWVISREGRNGNSRALATIRAASASKAMEEYVETTLSDMYDEIEFITPGRVLCTNPVVQAHYRTDRA